MRRSGNPRLRRELAAGRAPSLAEIAEAGGKAVANGADISVFAAAENLVQTAIEEFGRLDILVNVAGILRDRMVFNMTEQEWDDVIRVHLKGTFNTTRFASAHWRSLRDESAQNRIINFTSVSGLHGAPGQPNYAAAKMGIVGLTWSSARALGKYGVTVNAISPGAATRMTDSVPTDRRRTRPEVDEWSPDNVAPIVAYLASERSGWITGRIIHSSGYEVSLYSNPEPVVRIVGTGPWQPDALAEQDGMILQFMVVPVRPLLELVSDAEPPCLLRRRLRGGKLQGLHTLGMRPRAGEPAVTERGAPHVYLPIDGIAAYKLTDNVTLALNGDYGRIGRPAATRAVGAANGKNPLPIVVPCHRVIGADGSLTGFGGGISIKRRLLDLEAGAPGLLTESH